MNSSSDPFERAEKNKMMAMAMCAVLAFVPVISLFGNLLTAFLMALGIGALAGGATMVRWLRTPEGQACLHAESRISGRSTSHVAVWIGNLSPGLILVSVAMLVQFWWT